MRTLFREYLRLGRGERSGYAILLTLIFILLVFRLWLADLIFAPSGKEKQELLATLQAIEFPSHSTEIEETGITSEPVRFTFDPNSASAGELASLGIPDHLVERLIKFRSAGGSFYKPGDLGKIYGFPENLREELQPFVRIRKKAVKPGRKFQFFERHQADYTPTVPVLINMNTADSSAFVKLRGIGPVLADRIIRYREALGGFIQEDQIREVWGIDTALIPDLLLLLTTDSLHVRKLNINTASREDLAAHPYISPKLAMLIVNYRSQHGNYAYVSDLAKLYPVNDSILSRISPYLSTR